jgi:hypothetical protein
MNELAIVGQPLEWERFRTKYICAQPREFSWGNERPEMGWLTNSKDSKLLGTDAQFV